MSYTFKMANQTIDRGMNLIRGRGGLLLNPQMVTNTFNPLVVMISQTDPNGEITYYHYDNFNRLQSANDQDLNILKHYTYHYKNP